MNEPIEKTWGINFTEIIINLNELKKNINCKICSGIYESTSAFFEGYKKIFLVAFDHIIEEIGPFINRCEKESPFFEALGHLEFLRQNLVKYAGKKIEDLGGEDPIKIYFDWEFLEGYLEPNLNKCEKCSLLFKHLIEMKALYLLDLKTFISHLPSLPEEYIDTIKKSKK